MGNVEWKKCKILVSLIGTEEDINRRKILAIEAHKTLNSIFIRDENLNLDQIKNL